jgi:ubiquinone/menaquinone biosynthesis C-methylase UbiE
MLSPDVKESGGGSSRGPIVEMKKNYFVPSLGFEETRIDEVYRRRSASQRYSWFDKGHVFTLQQLERRLLSAIRRFGVAPLHSTKILEVGCGNGYWLREFVKWGASPENVTGVELLRSRVTLARKLCPKGVKVQHENAAQISFADASFDLVFQATVFTSILDSRLKTRVAAEMLRVLRQDGLILWYDFHVNNPRNPDVRGVKKREIANLFPGCRIKLGKITLAPPVVRLLAPHSWTLCELLEAVPWLCTHYLGVIRKPPTSTLSGSHRSNT